MWEENILNHFEDNKSEMWFLFMNLYIVDFTQINNAPAYKTLIKTMLKGDFLSIAAHNKKKKNEINFFICDENVSLCSCFLSVTYSST